MHLPSAKVFPYAYLTPSFIIILEVALGHGFPSFSIAAGAALTVMGLVVMLAARD
jgi:hypothetical protein